MLYSFIIVWCAIYTHEVGHFLSARFLGYEASIQIKLLSLTFVTLVHGMDTVNIRHKKIVAVGGCLATICCAAIVYMLPIDSNFKILFNMYTFVFLFNLHPKLPDGQIFWQ